MTEATWALVGVTFFLVVGAAWYAAETRRLANRMDRELEARTRPVLAFHLVPWHPTVVKLRIQNVGPGAAFDISGVIEGSSDGKASSLPWAYPLLLPGKYEEFGFPAAHDDRDARHRLEKVRQRFESVRARFTYKSATGDQYELDSMIKVRDITDDWVESQMMATQDHPERLAPRIAKALDSIAESAKRIRYP